MNSKNSGFTLIELLVVITVIGLLAAVVLVYVNYARITARNNKRLADVTQLVKAFKLASPDGSLPDTSGATLISGGSSSGYACVSQACYGAFSDYQNYWPVTAFLSPALSVYPSDASDNTRTAGGYLFNSNLVANATGPAGNYLPSGPVIQYFLEIRGTPNCGTGILWKVTSDRAVCYMLLN